jgi:hypothetical protein
VDLADPCSQADILIELAQSTELFHTPDGSAFADLDINGHRETWPIRAKGFRRCEPLQGVRCKGRAWIGRGPLDESLQRIADVLGRVDGGDDEILGFVRLAAVHCAASSMRGARPKSRSLKSIP